MPNTVPLYTHSLDDARHCNEVDEWRASHRANIECARAIEKAISRDYKDNHLDENCARSVIDEYGFNRVNFVLKVNLQLMPKDDPRISSENRKWGENFYTPKSNMRSEYRVNSHPVIFNGFIDEARDEWNKLGLFDSQHCHTDLGLNYEGKVLVISPNRLKDQYKTPEDQLFYATGGFGCHPNKIGRSVFGYFLKDGEHTTWDRSAFIGVIRDECLPQWAADKLAEYTEDTGESEGIGDIS